jgi:hypothetical protein
MATYKQSVVFFLDLLGFKNIIDENILSVDQILKMFKFNKSMIEGDTGTVKVLHGSDSIFITFDHDDPSKLFYQIIFIMCFQANLVAKYGILLRGGSAIGDLYHKGNTIFGPAVNAAVEAEKRASVPKISITSEVIDICVQYSVVRNSTDDEKNEIINLLGRDEDGSYYIDYISYDTFGDECDNYEQWAEYMIELKRVIENGLSDPDERVRNKYTWLRNKYNQALTDTIMNNYRDKLGYNLYRIRVP